MPMGDSDNVYENMGLCTLTLYATPHSAAYKDHVAAPSCLPHIPESLRGLQDG